jgi:hypothetical protein
MLCLSGWAVGDESNASVASKSRKPRPGPVKRLAAGSRDHVAATFNKVKSVVKKGLRRLPRRCTKASLRNERNIAGRTASMMMPMPLPFQNPLLAIMIAFSPIAQ